MSGWLPPGVTDADIDRAAPGYEDEPGEIHPMLQDVPFHCICRKQHCADVGLDQCELCEWEERGKT